MSIHKRVVAMFIVCAGLANANQLTNPEMETAGVGGAADPSGWFRTDTSIVKRREEAGQSGHGDWMILFSDNTNAFHSASQTFPVVGGAEYTALAEFKGLMQAGESMSIGLYWLDSAGAEMSTNSASYTTGDADYADWAWVTRSVTTAAPAGAVQVEAALVSKLDGAFDSAVFADNAVFLSLESARPAQIMGWSSVSSNTMEMVVHAPDPANNYHPKSTTNLTAGTWGSAAHSDDGVNPFVVTNLDYSTTDASGTNRVVYLQANAENEFFGLGKKAGLFGSVKTMFQTDQRYDARQGMAVDGVIVHRHSVGLLDLNSHSSSWQARGGKVGRMFFADSDAGNIYWTGGWDGTNHTDDVEIDSSGNQITAGGTRPYMVPTSGWTSYLMEETEKALLAGASAIFPEEPLAHAYSGYSPSFKQLWVDHYGIPWQAQDSSALARFLTAQLKSKLYFDLEETLMETTHSYEGARVSDPAFIIPIHSIYGNIAAQLVAPLGASTTLGEVDGYIGQIWTGPINWSLAQYASSEKSFFGSAYALYDYFTQLTVGTDKKLWLLVDPVEDDPNHTWAEFSEWYQHSVTAMLMMPMVDSYEVMPWPERIFLPGFQTGGGTPAPDDFRKTVLAITQVLQEIPLGGQWSMMGSDEVSAGIAVAIADSSMWKEYNSTNLQGVYGQLLPLIERGVPVSACVLERAAGMPYMDSHTVIVVSYEDFKPVAEEMNTDLTAWVQRGGVLILLGNSNDDLDGDPSFWWSQLGFASPMHHLLDQVGGTGPGDWSFGSGYVIRNEVSPAAFANPGVATSTYLPLIDLAIQHTDSGGTLFTPGYFMMQRGPFVIAHARSQAISAVGQFVDIYDPDLSIVNGISLALGESGLFREVTQIVDGGGPPQVLHATHRLMSQQSDAAGVQFFVKGPRDTPAVVRVFLGGQSISSITAVDSAGQSVSVTQTAEGTTARLEFPNDPDGVDVTVQM